MHGCTSFSAGTGCPFRKFLPAPRTRRNAPGAQAWPITATNFILVYKQPKDAAKAKHTLDFFKWAYEQGQAQANELDYVPLPPELVGQIEQYWNTEIKL